MGNVTVVALELGVNRNTAFGWARKAGRGSVRLLRRHPRRDEYEQLRACGGAEVTRRVITLGTPYRGSLDALLALVNGVGPAGIGLTAFARSLP
ncbi:hypothetical protein ACFU98_24635 [Streptomyces sp. NPDC057575]|uniref:hypothetical protein n=1 Tax=unclassified Streptomyces TaxID=2593676 RepID=UPI0036C71F61